MQIRSYVILACLLGAAGCASDAGANDDAPASTSTMLSAQAIAASSLTIGNTYTCALSSSGGVLCWGNNDHGQLGNNSQVGSSSPVPVVGLDSGATAVSAGLFHTCAVVSGGGVECWGFNQSGQLGDGSQVDEQIPVGVYGLHSGVVAVSGGASHTCALTSGGGVKCWGSNSVGQLGNGTTIDSNTPVDVVGLGSGVTLIAVGGAHSCALTSDGAVKCWGQGPELGSNATTSSPVPVDVVGLGSGVISLSAGPLITCAVTAVGGVKCWGSNQYGGLGNNSKADSLVPVDVVGLTSAASTVFASDGHACARLTSGGMQCWGQNTFGELGNGATTDSGTAVGVIGLSTVSTLPDHGAGYFTCSQTADGHRWCWGINWAGQLGNNSTVNSSQPVTVDWF